MSLMQELHTRITEIVVSEFGNPEAKAPDFDLPPEAAMGHLSMPCFPLAKTCRRAPRQIAARIAELLVDDPRVASAEAAGPYLNLRLRPADWFAEVLPSRLKGDAGEGLLPDEERRHVVVEFSCPNTNKPQHLGHVRNNVLGQSLARLLAAVGHRVTKVNLINDRGIHICKSMLAWQRWGEGETPQSSGLKGDHLVGRYYVLFAKKLAEEEQAWRAANGYGEKGTPEEEQRRSAAFEQASGLLADTRAMLVRWEKEDPEIRSLWSTMNGWVFAGFDETYRRMGVTFDKVYYESNTYLLGRDLVEDGLARGIFERHESGAVQCPLPELKLDPKVLLRSDGTTIYMTQDLGTAVERHREIPFDEMIYVVGSEQEHHFKVLFTILGKLGHAWAEKLYHLSYGMVNLTTGKMKSREGLVVDADDLLDELHSSCLRVMNESERRSDFEESKKAEVAAALADGALKYYVLKVNPRLDMLYDPQKSIELTGDTGPYLQYALARIRSLVRKSGLDPAACGDFGALGEAEEIELLKLLAFWPRQVLLAAEQRNPARLAGRIYDLARAFSSFFSAHSVFDRVEDPALAQQRVALAAAVGATLEQGLELLGIATPERI